MATNTPEKSKNRKLLVVGLILVLISVNGILFYMQTKLKTDKRKS